MPNNDLLSGDGYIFSNLQSLKYVLFVHAPKRCKRKALYVTPHSNSISNLRIYDIYM